MAAAGCTGTRVVEAGSPLAAVGKPPGVSLPELVHAQVNAAAETTIVGFRLFSQIPAREHIVRRCRQPGLTRRHFVS